MVFGVYCIVVTLVNEWLSLKTEFITFLHRESVGLQNLSNCDDSWNSWYRYTADISMHNALQTA